MSCALARRIGAPAVMSTNARDLVPHDDPLAVPCSPSLDAVRAELAAADVVLAIGTEWGRTDFDMYDHGDPVLGGRLIRVDIDPEQVNRGAPADVPLVGDAAGTVAALLEVLGEGAPAATGPDRAAAIRAAAYDELGDSYRAIHGFLEMVRDALPGAALVGDSTNPVYAGNLMFGTGRGGRWFNAATGYGALGYGLPAAIGAAIASGRPAVALVGDGGIQFSLGDLGTIVEEDLPVIVLVWNNRGYGEIKRYMVDARVSPVGVDLATPAFADIAKAYGGIGHVLQLPGDLPGLMRGAAVRRGLTLIEIDEALVLGGA